MLITPEERLIDQGLGIVTGPMKQGLVRELNGYLFVNGMRRCGTCTEIKQVEEFTSCSRSGYGIKPTCKSCMAEYWNSDKRREMARGYYAKDKEKMRIRKRELTYGITEEEYQEKLKEQNYVCAICKQPERRISWGTKEILAMQVDHNHVTDEVRGLLCSDCNTGIGRLKDSLELLRSAIEYLEIYE